MLPEAPDFNREMEVRMCGKNFLASLTIWLMNGIEKCTMTQKIRFTVINPGEKILDIGCSTGVIVSYIIEMI